MPLIALAIGSGIGLLKHVAVDLPKEKRQRVLAAETQRLSPWTKMQAGPIQEADLLSNMLAFGSTGAQLGAGIQSHQKAMMDKTPQFVSGGGIGAINAPAAAAPNMGAGTANAWGGAPRYSLVPDLYGQQNPWGLSGGGYGTY